MRKILCLALTAAAMSQAAFAVTPPSSDSSSSTAAMPQTAADGGNPAVKSSVTLAPFSRLGLSAGIGAGGINLQAATNMNKYMNLRIVGNVFKYSVNNITSNGMTFNGNLNLASSGVSVDLYPFPNHGLRFSPGALFYNQNAANAGVTVTGGTSFKLNNDTYYSSASSPVVGTGTLGLNSQNPAFTMTAGWGNLISRRGGHFSIPFEIGAAFVSTPNVNIAFTQGQVCDSTGANCQNVTTDNQLQADLQAQIAKYKNDLNPLKVYPIFSIGIGYNFKIR